MENLINKIQGHIEARNDIIGRNKYNQLKQLKDPTEKQLIQIQEFESRHTKKISEEDKNRIIEYYKKVSSPPIKKEFNFSADQLFIAFKKAYKINEGVDFIINEETKENIKTLIYYFSRDNRFLKCKNLHRTFDYGKIVKESIPSFDKGIIIIGNYGNGKSSGMKAFQRIFAPFDNLKFRMYLASEVVDNYECCSTQDDKRQFWYLMNKDVIYYDDVKREGIASNYGKANLFKGIIEKREARRLKTYITCNFNEEFPNDINAALLEFGEKYESYIFDRLFSAYNIIEFKGKSFRK